jgi:hypothetical protein
VVEHETPVRVYLEQQLADDGFEVLSTDRCTSALELVEQVRPNLVLLDAVSTTASQSRRPRDHLRFVHGAGPPGKRRRAASRARAGRGTLASA